MLSKKLIVGAGLSGLVAGLSLARRGHQVSILEKRTRSQLLREESGRSINLTVSERGLSALERTGLASDGVRHLGVAAAARCVHYRGGAQSVMPYGVNGESIYSISRSEMLRYWFTLAEAEPSVEFHFGVTNVSWTEEGGALRVGVARTGQPAICLEADQLFGADGVHSLVRKQLESSAGFRFTHQRFPYGYKEFRLSVAHVRALGLSANAIHSWPRDGLFLMAFPNRDGSFRAILFIPESGPRSLESITAIANARGILQECLGDLAQETVTELALEMAARPAGWLSEVACAPWVHAGRIALLGDAAHGMLPFYGQGINSIFEDCEVLNRCLEEHASDSRRALREYWQSRKPDTDAIAELSRVNFCELIERPSNDSVMHKRIEARLCELHPNRLAPLYGMVAFSSTPYRKVLDRHRWQREIVRSLAAMKWEEEELHEPRFSAAVLRVLEQQGEQDELTDQRPRLTRLHSAAPDTANHSDLTAAAKLSGLG